MNKVIYFGMAVSTVFTWGCDHIEQTRIAVGTLLNTNLQEMRFTLPQSDGPWWIVVPSGAVATGSGTVTVDISNESITIPVSVRFGNNTAIQISPGRKVTAFKGDAQQFLRQSSGFAGLSLQADKKVSLTMYFTLNGHIGDPLPVVAHTQDLAP